MKKPIKLDVNLRDQRRSAMMKSITAHPLARYSDINLSATFNDYDQSEEIDQFWYHLREIIEAAHEAELVFIPNGDAHTYMRIIRDAFEANDVYNRIRTLTETTTLRLYQKQESSQLITHEHGRGRVLRPRTTWELYVIPHVIY